MVWEFFYRIDKTTVLRFQNVVKGGLLFETQAIFRKYIKFILQVLAVCINVW